MSPAELDALTKRQIKIEAAQAEAAGLKKQ
jgi:hypothetical protein